MIRFARLFATLDQTNSTNAKVDAMAEYFSEAPAADAAWATFFLTGRRIKRLVPYAAVSRWTMAATGVAEWMLMECYSVVGDGAETAALVLDQINPMVPAGRGFSSDANPLFLAEWVEQRILPLRHMDADDQEAAVLDWVRPLDRWQRLVLFKLLTGELRLGVSHTLVVRALARVSAVAPTTMAARLMGEWQPSAAWFESLLSPGVTSDDLSKPYPFCLASPFDGEPFDLTAWQVEWKWDGIRAQVVKRAGHIHVWSRGEELITDRFPEVLDAARSLSDGMVLDGEIVAFRDGRPLPFSALQQRIGRERQVARKARDVPVVFMAYDVLELEGADVRAEPLSRRRPMLEALVSTAAEHPAMPQQQPATAAPLLPFEEDQHAHRQAVLRISPILRVESWGHLMRLRSESRTFGVEGVMLKRHDSPYGVGRKRGDWWKWKIEPFTIDAVLIYAQPGSGKRASLLTDYTFGVWDRGELVPVAKAYSGLTNEEIAEMDRWIRRHTIERFGPVRHVEPIHVFELGFEAIAKSTRHRSGIAVRFPRMLRWRKDKPASEADTLETVVKLVRS
jgi:DNA ligase 1